MNPAPRTLRSLIASSPFKAPPRKPAQQARYDRVLGAAELVLAKFGRPNITMANLALGLELSTSTLRRLVIDMDYLLYLLLSRHLTALLTTLAEIQGNTPDSQQQRRAAYLAATRAPDGSLNNAHTLLLRDAAHLPEDLLPEIETQRQALAQALGGENAYLGKQILLLLDDPALTLEDVEKIIPRCEKRAAKLAEQQRTWAAHPTMPAPQPPEPMPFEAWLTDAELEQVLGPPRAMAA